MTPFGETTSIPIPSGAWALDVEPVLTEQKEEAIQQEISQGESRPQHEEITSTPPPLQRIVEALLFVAASPLSASQFSGIIRGLTPGHLEETIRAMNVQYRRQGRPYTITELENGFRLILRNPYRVHLESLYGGVKEARFSPLAIQTLSIVAYRQPITPAQIEVILGQDSGSPLRQLVRRGMVQIQGKDEQGCSCYVTTPRFLEYFGLTRIEDLPKADDLERL